MNDFYRLVYTSRNHVDGGLHEQSASLSGILAVSKRNNARVGVTGALLFNSGCFAQVLEGPRTAVEATFERIQRDHRHGDVSVLQCEPVTARGFPNWSMGFVGQSTRGRALWEGIARESAFDITRMAGDTLFATLLAIVEEENEPASEPPQAFEPLARKLDVERLRAELRSPQILETGFAAEPDVGASATTSRPSIASSMPQKRLPEFDGSATDVLRAALSDERARTTALRAELDEARIELAGLRDEMKAVERYRDVWAERAKALAAALIREPDFERHDVEATVERLRRGAGR